MSFGLLPPEVNSGRLFFGAGPESLERAASSWGDLAMGLRQVAANSRTIAAALITGWRNPLSLLPFRIMTVYADWLDTAASAAAHTAIQATTAVEAYEAARAAVVRPEVILANRIRRAGLRASNSLGQFSAAIAEADAEYDQMWVDDARAMYSYARAAARASDLNLLGSAALRVEPPAVTSDVTSRQIERRLRAAPELIAASNEVMTAIPRILNGFVAFPEATVDVHLQPTTPALSRLCALSSSSATAIQHLAYMNRTMHLARAASSALRRDGRGHARAAVVGALSVPAGWIGSAAAHSLDADIVVCGGKTLRLVDATTQPDDQPALSTPGLRRGR